MTKESDNIFNIVNVFYQNNSVSATQNVRALGELRYLGQVKMQNLGEELSGSERFSLPEVGVVIPSADTVLIRTERLL